MNLYEIDEAIINCVDIETGEIVDTEAFDKLNIERDKKIENLALWVKNLEADVIAYKGERDSFDRKMKKAANKAKSIKLYLSGALQGNKFSTSRVDISFRKSEAVVIADNVDIETLPKEFVNTEIEMVVNKKAVKEYLKAGNELKGIYIKENKNINIK